MQSSHTYIVTDKQSNIMIDYHNSSNILVSCPCIFTDYFLCRRETHRWTTEIHYSPVLYNPVFLKKKQAQVICIFFFLYTSERSTSQNIRKQNLLLFHTFLYFVRSSFTIQIGCDFKPIKAYEKFRTKCWSGISWSGEFFFFGLVFLYILRETKTIKKKK